MRAIYSPAKGGAWVLTAILVTTACQATPHSSSLGLDRRLTEATLTAERDSLVMEVAATGKLLTDIQEELNRVPPVAVAVNSSESHAPESAYDLRRNTLERVRATATRLKAAETRLASTERRLAKITTVRDSLQGSLVSLQATLEQQRTTVNELTTHLDSIELENAQLAEQLYRLSDERSTAYYIVGTRKELVAKGVLVADGPRTIPLVGKRSLQPARDLPVAEFTSIDRNNVLELPLPRSDGRYRIVSRQNTAHLVSNEQRGDISGVIQIASPDGFWEGSRYLIVVEQ
jgi:hypothetical protein